VRLAGVRPGRRPPDELRGAVLARDLRVGGERWAKGRRLDAADLEALAAAPLDLGARETTVLVLETGELHEDEAARRLADAIRGPGLTVRGPVQSRIDLVAEIAGVVHVRVAAVDAIDRLDPLEVFTVLDGQVVSAGDLVASVKVAPHVVPGSVVAAGERVAARRGPVVRVAPFVPRRVGVLVKESISGPARARFEASARAKVESLGSTVVSVDYVPDDDAAVVVALEKLTGGRGRVDLVLTAGAASTDPGDPLYVAIDRLGGRVVRHGVPAHPGSMLWLARVGRTGILGLPTCGAYSKATAADLLIPRLLTGEPVSARTIARLGHGGILTRSMRFRFPPYARELDAPDG
jgi:molybdenum cofactor cytidylyltransferase